MADEKNVPLNPEVTDNVEDEITVPEELARRRMERLATDDGDASHEGGMGAQGGAADFGNPKNFA